MRVSNEGKFKNTVKRKLNTSKRYGSRLTLETPLLIYLVLLLLLSLSLFSLPVSATGADTPHLQAIKTKHTNIVRGESLFPGEIEWSRQQQQQQQQHQYHSSCGGNYHVVSNSRDRDIGNQPHFQLLDQLLQDVIERDQIVEISHYLSESLPTASELDLWIKELEHFIISGSDDNDGDPQYDDIEDILILLLLDTSIGVDVDSGDDNEKNNNNNSNSENNNNNHHTIETLDKSINTLKSQYTKQQSEFVSDIEALLPVVSDTLVLCALFTVFEIALCISLSIIIYTLRYLCRILIAVVVWVYKQIVSCRKQQQQQQSPLDAHINYIDKKDRKNNVNIGNGNIIDNDDDNDSDDDNGDIDDTNHNHHYHNFRNDNDGSGLLGSIKYTALYIVSIPYNIVVYLIQKCIASRHIFHLIAQYLSIFSVFIVFWLANTYTRISIRAKRISERIRMKRAARHVFEGDSPSTPSSSSPSGIVAATGGSRPKYARRKRTDAIIYSNSSKSNNSDSVEIGNSSGNIKPQTISQRKRKQVESGSIYQSICKETRPCLSKVPETLRTTATTATTTAAVAEAEAAEKRVTREKAAEIKKKTPISTLVDNKKSYYYHPTLDDVYYYADQKLNFSTSENNTKHHVYWDDSEDKLHIIQNGDDDDDDDDHNKNSNKTYKIPPVSLNDNRDRVAIDKIASLVNNDTNDDDDSGNSDGAHVTSINVDENKDNDTRHNRNIDSSRNEKCNGGTSKFIPLVEVVDMRHYNGAQSRRDKKSPSPPSQSQINYEKRYSGNRAPFRVKQLCKHTSSYDVHNIMPTTVTDITKRNSNSNNIDEHQWDERQRLSPLSLSPLYTENKKHSSSNNSNDNNTNTTTIPKISKISPVNPIIKSTWTPRTSNVLSTTQASVEWDDTWEGISYITDITDSGDVGNVSVVKRAPLAPKYKSKCR